MSKLDWDITQLRAYNSLSSDEAHVLWSAELPSTRAHDPALWDLQMGFFEDAIVNFSRQPGNLVVTPVSIPSFAFLRCLSCQQPSDFCLSFYLHCFCKHSASC